MQIYRLKKEYWCDAHQGTYTLENVINYTKEYFGESIWSRVTSFTTDTCNVMKAAWQIMRQDPRIQKSFFIPCDSHGIQLLVKDILTLPTVHETFSGVSSVVSYFRSSPKQWAILQGMQQYGRK